MEIEDREATYLLLYLFVLPLLYQRNKKETLSGLKLAYLRAKKDYLAYIIGLGSFESKRGLVCVI